MNTIRCSGPASPCARATTKVVALCLRVVVLGSVDMADAGFAGPEEPMHCVHIVEVQTIDEVPFLVPVPEEVKSEWRWELVNDQEGPETWTLTVRIPSGAAPRRVTTRVYTHTGRFVGSVAYGWCMIGVSLGRSPSQWPQLRALATVLSPRGGLEETLAELTGHDTYVKAFGELSQKICRMSDLDIELASYRAACYTDEELRALPLDQRLEARLWRDLWAPPWNARWCYVLRRGACVTLIETNAEDPADMKANFAIQRFFKGRALWMLTVWQGPNAARPEGWKDFLRYVLRTAVDNECPQDATSDCTQPAQRASIREDVRSCTQRPRADTALRFHARPHRGGRVEVARQPGQPGLGSPRELERVQRDDRSDADDDHIGSSGDDT